MPRYPEYQIHSLDTHGYGRVIQTIDGKFYDGWGNTVIFTLFGKEVSINVEGVGEDSTDGGNVNVTNEALPNDQSVVQLKKVMKVSAKTDIGNRISDMNKQGANIQYIQNPIDTGIESYEDYEKHNKKFVSSWNLKGLLGPFKGEDNKQNK